MRRDGQTDRHDDSRFLQFCERPKERDFFFQLRVGYSSFSNSLRSPDMLKNSEL
jgi:hypothetical protein